MSVAFRAVQRLYPAEFRNEYGTEMECIYQDLRRDQSAAAVWMRLARDTAIAVPRMRLEAGMKRSVIVSGSAVVLGVAAVGIMTGNFFVGSLVFLSVGAALLIPSALLAKRSRASAESDYTTKQWPLWTYPAAAIAVVYVAFGIGQLISEPKKEHVFTLFLFTGFAAMIARGLVIRRSGRVAGDWMIAAAALPLLGGFWMVWPTVLSVIVMVGAMSEALTVRPARAA